MYFVAARIISPSNPNRHVFSGTRQKKKPASLLHDQLSRNPFFIFTTVTPLSTTAVAASPREQSVEEASLQRWLSV